MGNETNVANWAAQERLRAVERAVWWRGWVRRGDVTEVFGVSAAQASSDLQKYQALNPGALVYQMSRKRYEGAASMRCCLHEPRLEEGMGMFLEGAALSGFGVGVATAAGERVAAVRLPLRKAAARVERVMFQAVCAGRRRVRVKYWSVNSGTAEERSIVPHAFGHDGSRWHVRAWCCRNEGYRDFVLGRIEEAQWPDEMEAGEVLPGDEDWERWEVVRVGPNLGLSEVQRRAIRMDYGMGEEGVLELRVRGAMKGYLLEQLRIPGGEHEALPRHFNVVG